MPGGNALPDGDAGEDAPTCCGGGEETGGGSVSVGKEFGVICAASAASRSAAFSAFVRRPRRGAEDGSFAAAAV